jgi:integrase-like protein
MIIRTAGRQPLHLIHDRDTVYGDDFGTKMADVGIADIQTPDRAPLGNSVAERVVRTFRQECLDHVIVLNERHLLALLSEFVRYYNHDRPHRALELGTPAPRPPMSSGPVVSRPILGGLHHVYARGRELGPLLPPHNHPVALSEFTRHFRTARTHLLTARFRVRIPTPEPNSCASSADRSQKAFGRCVTQLRLMCHSNFG